MSDVSDLDYAWAAGFLDGEGCFTPLKHSSSITHPSQRAVHISASQTRRAPLEKLQGLLGGNINENMLPTTSGSRIWQWRIQNARDVRSAVTLVLPYLVVKRREAEIVAAFATTIRHRGRPKRDAVRHTSQIEIDLRMVLIAEMAEIRGH